MSSTQPKNKYASVRLNDLLITEQQNIGKAIVKNDLLYFEKLLNKMEELEEENGVEDKFERLACDAIHSTILTLAGQDYNEVNCALRLINKGSSKFELKFLEELAQRSVVKNSLAERIPKHILQKFIHIGLISKPRFPSASTYWYFANGGSTEDNVWILNEKHLLEVKKYFENYILA